MHYFFKKISVKNGVIVIKWKNQILQIIDHGSITDRKDQGKDQMEKTKNLIQKCHARIQKFRKRKTSPTKEYHLRSQKRNIERERETAKHDAVFF